MEWGGGLYLCFVLYCNLQYQTYVNQSLVQIGFKLIFSPCLCAYGINDTPIDNTYLPRKITKLYELKTCSYLLMTTTHGNCIRPRGYKSFSMLNSAEHEISTTQKTKILTNTEVSCFKSLRFFMYLSNKC